MYAVSQNSIGVYILRTMYVPPLLFRMGRMREGGECKMTSEQIALFFNGSGFALAACGTASSDLATMPRDRIAHPPTSAQRYFTRYFYGKIWLDEYFALHVLYNRQVPRRTTS